MISKTLFNQRRYMILSWTTDAHTHKAYLAAESSLNIYWELIEIMISAPNVTDIIDVTQERSYRVFRNMKGYDLNIVGIRSAQIDQQVYNDWITVFYMSDGRWNYFSFPGTTDPGSFYQQDPLNIRGTAILKPGQYRGSHKTGRHKNYKACSRKKQ